MAIKKRGLPAEFELFVMLSIACLEDGAYGAAVRRDIEETVRSRTSRLVLPGLSG